MGSTITRVAGRDGVLAVVAATLAVLALLRSLSGSHAAGDSRREVATLQIPFIANNGQTDPAVAFYAPTFAGTVFVTRDGQVVYSLPPGHSSGAAARAAAVPKQRGWSVTETFRDGTPHPRGNETATTRVNYFVGEDPSRWVRGLATLDDISLGNVWPGVSVSLRAHGKSVEKVFTIAAGADPSRIRMRVSGARSLKLEPTGALIAETGLGKMTLTTPSAYQPGDPASRRIEVAYEVHGEDYGFRLGDHDANRPVIIDPLLQATYLGGSASDVGFHLATNTTTGDVYVTGSTLSTDFPGTSGGAQQTNVGTDAFVALLSGDLMNLRQATYFGGSAEDAALGLAFDSSSGTVYIAGYTDSSDLPGMTGGAQPVSGGSRDAFVARFGSDLTTLEGATYIGGSDTDDAQALEIHPDSGDVYVVGETFGNTFPGVSGGAQATSGGGRNAFVARLSSNLTSLKQATYLGGSGAADQGRALAIDPISGDVYVAGFTNSIDLPGTSGGAQATLNGPGDAFVARLASDLTTIRQSTYFGGGGSEIGAALAISPISGDVYLGGWTSSTDLPYTAGGAQPSYGGGSEDAFVARLNPALTMIDRASYLGGSGNQDECWALAVHPMTGEVYLAGHTTSLTFPGTAGGAQSSAGSGIHAFVSRFSPDLTTLGQSSYLAGSGEDEGRAVLVDPVSGDVLVAGGTTSLDFPGSSGGAQPSYGGGTSFDAFVARLTWDLAAVAPATPTPTPSLTPTWTPTNVPTSTPTPAPTKAPTPANVPPAISSLGLSAASISENASVLLAGTFTDPDPGDAHTVTINWGDGSVVTNLSLPAGVFGFSASHQYLDDNPSGTPSDAYIVSVVVTDKAGATGSGSTTITVNNVPPVITGITGPTAPITLGGSASVAASFTDIGTLDTHVCTFAWGDGSANTTVAAAGTGNGSCSATHVYTSVGVYTTTVTVVDDDTGSAVGSSGYIVIYNPGAGFVTGGGTFNSPAGAYFAHPALTGSANFGFNSKYNNSNAPTGVTEFHFSDLNFHSSSYDWLVINSPNAQYQGSGTINNAGNYGFIVTVIDGQASGGGGVDKIRVKIWDKNNGNAIIYDNQMGAPDTANPTTQTTGGNITLHN
jgi:hypothetical protein